MSTTAQRVTHCLSVRNPWASLIVIGLKGIENRSWTTHYRGRIAIHASSKASEIEHYRGFIDDLPLVDDDEAARQIAEFLDDRFDAEDPENKIQSAVIGTAEIVAVHDAGAPDFNVAQLPEESPGYEMPPWQWASPAGSRYLWVLANPVAFATPIRCHGKLNLWRLGDELERQVASETERTLAAGPRW